MRTMAGDHCQNYLPYHFDFRRFFFLATLAHVSFVPKSRLFFFFGGGGCGGCGGRIVPVPIISYYPFQSLELALHVSVNFY